MLTERASQQSNMVEIHREKKKKTEEKNERKPTNVTILGGPLSSVGYIH